MSTRVRAHPPSDSLTGQNSPCHMKKKCASHTTFSVYCTIARQPFCEMRGPSCPSSVPRASTWAFTHRVDSLVLYFIHMPALGAGTPAASSPWSPMGSFWGHTYIPASSPPRVAFQVSLARRLGRDPKPGVASALSPSLWMKPLVSVSAFLFVFSPMRLTRSVLLKPRAMLEIIIRLLCTLDAYEDIVLQESLRRN